MNQLFLLLFRQAVVFLLFYPLGLQLLHDLLDRCPGHLEGSGQSNLSRRVLYEGCLGYFLEKRFYALIWALVRRQPLDPWGHSRFFLVIFLQNATNAAWGNHFSTIDFRYPEIFPGELKIGLAVEMAALVSELISAGISADKRKQWTNGNRKWRFSPKLKWGGEKSYGKVTSIV